MRFGKITNSFFILYPTLTDNAVNYAIRLILLNHSNFSIAKIVVKEIERVKLTLSRLPTNTELIFNKLVLIKTIQKS